MAMFTKHEKILMGKFGAPHGIKGAIKVHSWSTPTNNIFNYQPWHIHTETGWQTLEAKAYSKGTTLIALLDNVSDRDMAKMHTNIDIYVDKSQLPHLSSGQYYWSELAGMNVVTECQNNLGTVSYVFNTGANDILSVQGDRERLLPFVGDTIMDVNMASNTIVVNWDPNF
jgi:16S rRNA processing protein RimM